MCMEGIEHNPIVYELMSEMAFRSEKVQVLVIFNFLLLFNIIFLVRTIHYKYGRVQKLFKDTCVRVLKMFLHSSISVLSLNHMFFLSVTLTLQVISVLRMNVWWYWIMLDHRQFQKLKPLGSGPTMCIKHASMPHTNTLLHLQVHLIKLNWLLSFHV